MKKNTFYTKVIEVDGNVEMLFPEDLLKALTLKANEILQWTLVDEDTIRVTRTRYIDNQSNQSV